MTRNLSHYAYDIVGRSATTGNVVFSRTYKRVAVKDIDDHIRKLTARMKTCGIDAEVTNVVNLDVIPPRKTVTIDGETIAVTKHGNRDYSIAFEVGDYSVRGTLLDVVKTFAEWQASVLPEPAVSFEWQDRAISDPWLDPSARFPLDCTQAVVTYGEDNVLQFIIDACALLRPDKER